MDFAENEDKGKMIEAIEFGLPDNRRSSSLVKDTLQKMQIVKNIPKGQEILSAYKMKKFISRDHQNKQCVQS